jgi:ribonuclease HII
MKPARRVAGIDEAGRGPLAGPVVAAVVVLRPGQRIEGVADSKILDPETRLALARVIRRRALAFGIGWADPAEIDSLNILQATFLAMRRAVLALVVRPDLVLIDGDRLPCLDGLGAGLWGAGLPARAIVQGDVTEHVIGAASILAKTARDAYMERAHTLYPAYGFAAHKGYGTPLHRRQLQEHGPCPLHRRSFAPVGDWLAATDVPCGAEAVS